MEHLRRGSKFLKVILGFWLKIFQICEWILSYFSFKDGVQASIYLLNSFSVLGVNLILPLPLHFGKTHGIEHDHFQAFSLFS